MGPIGDSDEVRPVLTSCIWQKVSVSKCEKSLSEGRGNERPLSQPVPLTCLVLKLSFVACSTSLEFFEVRREISNYMLDISTTVYTRLGMPQAVSIECRPWIEVPSITKSLPQPATQ